MKYEGQKLNNFQKKKKKKNFWDKKKNKLGLSLRRKKKRFFWQKIDQFKQKNGLFGPKKQARAELKK